MESFSQWKLLRLWVEQWYNYHLMRSTENDTQNSKISREFQNRLDHLNPEQKVRAIVMLRTKKAQPVSASDRSTSNRQAIIDMVRRTAEAALSDIDKILYSFDGKRLAESVSALGSVPVEATADGIKALAKSEHVKAIFEDQTISSLPKLKQA